MSDSGESYGRADQIDPLPSLRALHQQGERETPRAVHLRVQWLRREQPETTITTELVHLDDRVAVVKATVTLPTGAASTCLAAEDFGPDDDRGAAIELAESHALGRALERLGYALTPLAAPAEADTDAADSVTDARPATPADANERLASATPPAPATQPDAAEPTGGPWFSSRQASSSPAGSTGSPNDDAARPQVVDALRRMRRSDGPDVPERPTAGSPERPDRADRPERSDSRRPPITLRPRGQSTQPAPAPASTEGDEAPLEDFSWSAFWKWARQRGFTSHDELGRAIGRPTQSLTPGQIRTALRDAGAVQD